jgi:hypothetical protein
VSGGVDPAAPVRFAVDLFDVGESTIKPGAVAVIEKLGEAAPAPGASGAPVPGEAPVTRPAARDELWAPILLLVLAGLCVEWALYHRDVVVRGWRSVANRFRRPARGPA